MRHEKWKEINGYPYYEVSNKGTVRSKDKYVKCGNGYVWKRGKIIASHPNRDGYLMLRIRNSPLDKKFVPVHVLVANAFVENPSYLLEINHKDGRKENNHWTNLEWVTRSENLLHAFSIGLRISKKGEKSNLSKLKERDILEIRRLAAEGGRSHVEIAKLYKVSGMCIGLIVSKKSWSHIS